MPQNFSRIFLLWTGILLAGLLPGRAAQLIEARAAFEPAEVTVGQQGFYTIRIEGSSAWPRIQLPTPPAGLVIVSRSVSTQSGTSVVNGKASSWVQVNLPFVAKQAGRFELPSFTVELDGEKVAIPAAVVNAREAEAPQTPAPAVGPLAGKLPVAPNPAPSNQTVATFPAQAAPPVLYLHLELPREKLWVGEMLPLNLVLFARKGIPVVDMALPKIGSEAFLAAAVDAVPQAVEKNWSGYPYMALPLRTALTPVKAGRQEVSFTQQILVETTPTDEEMLRDPLFRLTWGLFPQREERTLQSPRKEVEVLDVPTEGQPAGYTGAIGNFAIEKVTLSASEAALGEPVTLRVALRGKGNFERIQPPALPADAIWKTYPPKAEFTPSSKLGYEGVKIFEYVLVPRQEGTCIVPPFRLAFFDPDSGQYSVLAPAMPTLTVHAAVQPTAPVAPAASATAPAANTAPAAAPSPAKTDTVAVDPSQEAVFNIMLEPGSLRSSLQPPFCRVGFWVLQGLLAAVVGGLAGWRWRKLRFEGDPMLQQRRAASEAVEAALQACREAIRKDQPVAFAAAAGQAVLAAVSPLARGTSLGALTVAEVQELLAETGLAEETGKEALRYLEAAEACRFGGAQPRGFQPANELPKLEQLCRQLLRGKESRS